MGLFCVIDLDVGKDDGKTTQQQYDWWRGEQLKQRELFLSRQVETLAATHIRGKCTVTLYNETESLDSYLERDVSVKQNYEINNEYLFIVCFLLTY